jgi:hypothetical protein
MLTEKEMVHNCYSFFKDKGYLVAKEVPFLQRSIDLVYKNEENDLVAIEFKLHDWKRAMKQAKTHFYGTKKVYVCLPKPKRNISDNLLNLLENIPLGLMIYDLNEEEPIKVFQEVKDTNINWIAGQKCLKDAFLNRIEDSKCLNI